MAFQIGTSNIAFQIVIKMHFKFVWGEVGWDGLGRERENLTRGAPPTAPLPEKGSTTKKNMNACRKGTMVHAVFIVAKCRRLAPVPTDRGPHKSASFAIHLWDHYKDLYNSSLFP